MRKSGLWIIFSSTLTLVTLLWPGAVLAGEFAQIEFPATADGRLVLPVDFHSHTVFSDGVVWPTVHVERALAEGLAGIAITDHLEYQPNRADIPNRDRNRSYEIAVAEANTLAQSSGGRRLTVILGTEITRGNPPGHLNAVFLTDVNRLLPKGYPVYSEDADMLKFYDRSLVNWPSLHGALSTARQQGGFIILNHPSAQFDAQGKLNEHNLALIDEGLTNGIEVANGWTYQDAAFALALERNLTIIGASDLHDAPAHFDQFVKRWAGVTLPQESLAHRTVTLVLAQKGDAASIRAALFARSTAALYENQIIGRPAEVDAIVSGALRATIRRNESSKGQALVYIENRSSVPWLLQYVGKRPLLSVSEILTVPGKASYEIVVDGVSDDERAHLEPFEFEVLNAFIAPRVHPRIKLGWQR